MRPQPILLMLRDRETGKSRLMRCSKRRQSVSNQRQHKPENLEPRCLLSVTPIQFGAVYVEQDLGSDRSPDSIEISFVGGAENTRLTQLEINGDKFLPGLSLADMVFDTEDDGLGIDLAHHGVVTSQQGDFTTEVVVRDGSSRLLLKFEDFEAGDKLTLSVDVDEVQGDIGEEVDVELINEDLDPIASGAEFQGSILSAFFTAPHYYDARAEAEFRNRYDEALEPTDLDLPLDDANNNRDRTAGAVGELVQAPLPVSISGTVYEDRNTDLLQDAGDPGMNGVELSLYELVSEDYVFTGHTAITDSDGNYVFDTDLGILPGTYQVRETQPEGYFSVGANVGEVDGFVTGYAASADVLTAISIPNGGGQAVEYDFAEARTVSLQGRVHLSNPGGDCWDESIQHEPVAGATIVLLDDTGEPWDEATTNELGEYEFRNLRPGFYSILQRPPDQVFAGEARAGHVDGDVRGSFELTENGTVIRDIEMLSADEGRNFDFCNHRPASLSGSVYHDHDNDGVKSVGEEGIAGALLSLLDEDGLTVATAETDDSGRYEFVGLPSGNYRILELQPDDWLDGTDKAGTVANGSETRTTGRAINPGDEIEAIQLLWGDAGVDFDFGELKPSSIGGRVHLSTPDGDCWEIDEELLEPVAGAVVQLLDATGAVLAEAVTDENGDYMFDELPPGEYAIRELTPAGLVEGGSQVGSIGDVPEGRVNELGDIVDVTLRSNQTGVDYDFCEHKPAVISGFVFDDRNNDGVRDPNEEPIAGVTIQLFDEEGELVAETTTDATGQYFFEGLPPGVYALRQIQPDSFLDGLDSAGTINGERRGRAINPGDELVEIKIGWGETGQEYNFGELRPVSLSGSVHSSANEDCWEDEAADPIAGVRIVLFSDDGRLVAETTTSASGDYSFDGLAPGEYSVLQEQPDTVFDGAQRAGSSGGDASEPNVISGIQLVPGAIATNYEFCEVPPSSISGFVFVDGQPIEIESDTTLPDDVSAFRDGALSEDDTRLGGVVLELRNGINGTAIDAALALPGLYDAGPIQTMTDENGFYEFLGLPKGNYAVYEIQPEGYIDGIDTPGTTSGIAINPIPLDEDDIVIEAVINSLAVPPQNDAIVRIGLPPGQQSQLNNFSEVLVDRLPPPPPVVPPITPPAQPPMNPPSPPEDPPIAPPTQPIGRTLPPSTKLETPALYLRLRDVPEVPLVDNPIVHDGSHGAVARTWHLSVIDGGQPRVAHEPDGLNFLFPTSIWHAEQMDDARWQFTDAQQQQRVFYFGLRDGLPVTGDFNGDGETEVGIFSDGHWFIDLNGNGRWDSQDLWAKLGYDGDMPVVGDWDGDGKDDIGIFGRSWPGDSVAMQYEHGLPDLENAPDGARKNMPPKEKEEVIGHRAMKRTVSGELRKDVIDHVFVYGESNDVGVVGDWNGDGIDTVGIFRAGTWRLDVDGNGRWTATDEMAVFGELGDMPLVGDFNGDGIDDLAIIRNGKIYIDANGNHEIDINDLVLEFDESEGIPIVGRWGIDQSDDVGLFRPLEPGEVTVAIRPETE